VNLFVDTSVWSLALRRDGDEGAPTVVRLREAITSQDGLFTTGLVLQELLQGFQGPSARKGIIARFSSLPLITPDRDDHVAAAGLRNTCRRRGVQIGTIDALLAQLCVRHRLTMLSADGDFRHAARHVPLKVWTG
jgi:predicted nucleic acid-binding protein